MFEVVPEQQVSNTKFQLCRHFDKIKKMFARERILGNLTESKNRGRCQLYNPNMKSLNKINFKRYAQISSKQIREEGSLKLNQNQLQLLLLKSKSLNVKNMDANFNYLSPEKNMTNKKHFLVHRVRKLRYNEKNYPNTQDCTRSSLFDNINKQILESSQSIRMRQTNKIKTKQQRLSANAVLNKEQNASQQIIEYKKKANILYRSHYKNKNVAREIKKQSHNLQSLNKILLQKSLQLKTPSSLGPWKEAQNPQF